MEKGREEAAGKREALEHREGIPAMGNLLPLFGGERMRGGGGGRTYSSLSTSTSDRDPTKKKKGRMGLAVTSRRSDCAVDRQEGKQGFPES